MTEEKKNLYLKVISENLPPIVFQEFLDAWGRVTDVKESILSAIYKLIVGRSSQLRYKLAHHHTKDYYSAVNEILDLLEGWILISHIEVNGSISWIATLMKEEK